jgi:hypothetical protein
MVILTSTDYLNLTEWYHYAMLFVLFIFLLAGIKYYNKIEGFFSANPNTNKGVKLGKSMLISAFCLGLGMVIIWMFKPAELTINSEKNWIYAENLCYVLLFLLLLVNAYFSFTNYKLRSGIMRTIVISLLMVLYFYTGMLGGLVIMFVFAAIIVIYSLLKLKKTLTIR